MKVWVFCHCRNEREIMPYFIRHYAAFAEWIHVFDDMSEDGTPAIVARHPQTVLHTWPTDGLREDELLTLAYDNYPLAAGKADYAIWVDVDEFVYHPRILECLEAYKAEGFDVIRTLGFNMMGAPLPPDDGTSQLTDIYRTGVRAPVYSKPIIFNPEKRVRWSAGKHEFAFNHGLKIAPRFDECVPHPYVPRLLHYRYLTPEYTRERNARQYSRSVQKGAAWSNAPDHTGEHSPTWVAATMSKARDVVRDDACYLAPPFDA